MRRSVLVVLLAGLAVPCTPALAATVRLNEQTGVLEYRAAPGERNHVRISVSHDEPYGGHDFAYYSVEDSAPIKAGTGCRRAHRGRRQFVRCDVDTFGAVRAVVRLGDRNDVVRGGPEADVLLGGPGTDVLSGGGGVDRLLAGAFGMSVARTADRLVGGAQSDLLTGSAGPNLMDGGPGVDKVDAGRGRDIIQARDGAIEQLHCGGGEDSAITDGIDYPLACEHHEPYSRPSPVPLAFFTGPTGSAQVSLLLGCREAHPAACGGTVQLELDGRALSEERPFTFANRHRFVVPLDTSEPMSADWDRLVVRIRGRSADGAPTDDRYPLQTMLVGDPFLLPF